MEHPSGTKTWKELNDVMTWSYDEIRGAMTKSELINLLCSNDEEEVYIEIDDVLYDVEIGHQDMIFDGFDTAYPACITLSAKKE